jgi:glutamate formiminotransferase/formiminotetrahydrofolate cyclodeaminase
MRQLIECVPNFSEGRDMAIMKQITDQVETVDGVKLLDVDPGAATNRTVVTMVGTPEAVIESAFRCIKKAMEVIDMSRHKGEHPRFGATDVCPFVPVSNITMEETAVYARKLAERVGKELGIPVYCYENAAFTDERRNLANCRSGEYEGLPKKLKDQKWKPDFGPAEFLPRTGAIAIGARDFLVAYNINLNTTSTRRANAVAFDIREKGRPVRQSRHREDQKGQGWQRDMGTGPAPCLQSDRLVHRRVRHRAGLHQPDQHQHHPGARGVRRVVQKRAGTGHAGLRFRTGWPDPAQGHD